MSQILKDVELANPKAPSDGRWLRRIGPLPGPVVSYPRALAFRKRMVGKTTTATGTTSEMDGRANEIAAVLALRRLSAGN
jgi:hypothetical protein